MLDIHSDKGLSSVQQGQKVSRYAPGLFCQGCARSVPHLLTPLPLGFSQVFILKGVKVLCFDTLLQVFILKAVRRGGPPGKLRGNVPSVPKFQAEIHDTTLAFARFRQTNSRKNPTCFPW